MNHQFFTVWLITLVVGLRDGVVTLDPHHEVFSVHGLTVPLIAVSALAWISFSFLAFVSFRYSTENKQRIRVYYAQRWCHVSHVLKRFRYLNYWITTMFLCCLRGYLEQTYNCCLEIIRRRHLDSILYVCMYNLYFRLRNTEQHSHTVLGSIDSLSLCGTTQGFIIHYYHPP